MQADSGARSCYERQAALNGFNKPVRLSKPGRYLWFSRSGLLVIDEALGGKITAAREGRKTNFSIARVVRRFGAPDAIYKQSQL